MSVSSLTTTVSAGASTCAVVERARIEAAFDRYSRALYRYVVVRVGGDTHVADDLLQQLWLQVNRDGQAARHVPDEELEYWLKAVVRNLLRARWRKQQQRSAAGVQADERLTRELADRLETEELPPDILQHREVHAQLLHALTDLSSQDQALIIGQYFQERRQEELARELGISVRAVEGRLYRARLALRQKLREWNP